MEEKSTYLKTYKFEFRAIKSGDLWLTLDGLSEVTQYRYYKYSDGKNWDLFSREELVYMAIKSCADIQNYIMAPEIEKTPEQLLKQMQQQPLEFLPSKSTREKYLQIASTLPNRSLAELLDNAEKIERWVKGV